MTLAQRAVLIEAPPDAVTRNPWGTRRTYKREEIEALKRSLLTDGLLQRPIARRVPNGYQVSFGGKRVQAMRELSDEGKWTGIWLEVRDLTDEQMARFGFVENAKRSDGNPVEMFQAWQKALAEIDTLTLDKIALDYEIDRSTVSNNLRILSLPAWVLQLVDGERLPVRAARELLCFLGREHVHEDGLRFVFDAIEDGVPEEERDYKISTVRGWIREFVRETKAWAFLPKSSTDAALDLRAAFAEAYPDHVHNIPTPAQDREPWTCKAYAWEEIEAAAAKSGMKPASPSAQIADAYVKEADESVDRLMLGPETSGVGTPEEQPTAPQAAPQTAPKIATEPIQRRTAESAAAGAHVNVTSTNPRVEATQSGTAMVMGPNGGNANGTNATAHEHTDRCWQEHHTCAIARVVALEAAIEGNLAVARKLQEEVARVTQGTAAAGLEDPGEIPGGLKVVIQTRSAGGAMVNLGADGTDPRMQLVAGDLRDVLVRIPGLVRGAREAWGKAPRRPGVSMAPASKPAAKPEAKRAKAPKASPAVGDGAGDAEGEEGGED